MHRVPKLVNKLFLLHEWRAVVTVGRGRLFCSGRCVLREQRPAALRPGAVQQESLGQEAVPTLYNKQERRAFVSGLVSAKFGAGTDRRAYPVLTTKNGK